jgi:hypothetical protein
MKAHLSFQRKGSRLWIRASVCRFAAAMSRIPGQAGRCSVHTLECYEPPRAVWSSTRPIQPASRRCAGCECRKATSQCPITEPATIIHRVRPLGHHRLEVNGEGRITAFDESHYHRPAPAERSVRRMLLDVSIARCSYGGLNLRSFHRWSRLPNSRSI